ncbi:hypothetical protein F7725_005335, partial [Dissostichus mawsoni]
MESVEDFVRAPSEELLEGFSREQLICVAEHFHLDVGDKRLKENIRGIVKANLFELGAFKGGKYTVDPSRDSVNMSGCRDAGLTFEQRKELLLLQTEMEKLAVEKMRGEVEIKRLELEERRLNLPAGQPRVDPSEVCDFCRGRGHWKADCPKAKASRGNNGGQ